MVRRSPGTAVLLALLILPGFAHAQTVGDLPTRLRCAVASYEKLVEELDFNRLPGDRPDYPLVTENVERLGERLEALSREGMRLGEMDENERAGLQAAVELFEADLRQLRQQSLRLRVWGFWHQHGYKKPDWGLAVGDGAEAEAATELELKAKAGEKTAKSFVVVPVAKDLRGVRVSCSELRGKGGKVAKDAIRVVAAEHGTEGEKIDVARDATQGYVVEVAVPVGLKVGEYKGKVSVRPGNVKGLELEVRLVVE